MTEIEIAAIRDAETPEERRRRRMRWLADLQATQATILAERGGVPFSVEEIDQALDEIRGRVDEHLD